MTVMWGLRSAPQPMVEGPANIGTAGLLRDVKVAAAISIWVGALFGVLGSMLIAVLCLPHPLAMSWLTLMVALTLVPLKEETPGWAARMTRTSLRLAAEYNSMELRIEDPKALRSGRPYVVGYEPHSALPTAMPMVFCEHSPIIPPALKTVRVLATSACFYCPVVRHLWWWLGGRPASASVMRAMLGRDHSALVCPGGVRECLYMEHGREAIYLSNRTGFVRIALQYGAPLVPVFCFGQTDMYHWVKMGAPVIPQWLTERIARTIGFLPLFMYGIWGTFVPRKVKLTMVIGKPIEVPKLLEASNEEVQKHLDHFIEEMKKLFERHKASAGYPDLQLTVI